MLYLSEHYQDPLTVDELAHRIGCSRASLAALFRREIGSSVHSTLNLRLEHAAELLRSGTKVEAVCVAVGFRSRSTFFSQFRKHTGLTPAVYRSKHGRAAGGYPLSVGG